MTRLYIVRHGQTVWNKEQVFRGRVDVPLNELGLKEAEAVGEALREKNIRFIYSSPLSRAIQTATPTANLAGLEVIQHAGIIDMSFGEWEGKPLEDVERADPSRFRTWIERPHKVKIPGGETLKQVQDRAMQAVREIVSLHPDETGMLVSHRVVCKLLVLGLMGLGPESFWKVHQDTACLNLFSMKGDSVVALLINDTCHLKKIEGRITADF